MTPTDANGGDLDRGQDQVLADRRMKSGVKYAGR
jgi:hypothetical protein